MIRAGARDLLFVLALAFVFVLGCAGEAPPPPAPPVTARPVASSVEAAPPLPSRNDDRADAAVTSVTSPVDAGVEAAAPRAALPEPSFGAGPVRPGDAHPFRATAALRAMRASASGAKILRLLSALPEVIAVRTQTGVDPVADGEWLLVYGAKVGLPGANANVVKHGRPEAQVARAIADAGLEAFDAGTGLGVRAELLGVRDVLLQPQPGLLALVPSDRARDLAAALAKPFEPPAKAGELARIFVSEPAKLSRLVPAELVRGTVVVKPAADGGLDISADADCPDAASCKTIATSLEELVKHQNSMMVRFVLKNVLAGFSADADGTKLKVKLHAEPGQVDALLNILRAQLGLPADAPRP